MKLTRLLILPLMAFSSGCAIARPDTNLCIANAPGLRARCCNMRDAYTNDAKVISDKCVTFQFQSDKELLQFLNKSMFVPDMPNRSDLANLKFYVSVLRQYCD